MSPVSAIPSLPPASASAAHLPNEDMIRRVREELAKIETREEVRVLYACESGSRAWGFASTDSDFDVRFIYVHRRDWYLSIEDRRDVIEVPIDDELDISGWDLRKALTLLRKSNPPLLEWLKSPIIYHQDPVFTEEFQALAAECFSPARCFAHYLHMAAGNWRAYLRERSMVKLKKYLYVFRPVMGCRWIERRTGQVPMLFQELVDAVLEDGEVKDALQALVARKMAAVELDEEPPVTVLSDFLESELVRLETLNNPEPSPHGTEELNRFLRRWIAP